MEEIKREYEKEKLGEYARMRWQEKESKREERAREKKKQE